MCLLNWNKKSNISMSNFPKQTILGRDIRRLKTKITHNCSHYDAFVPYFKKLKRRFTGDLFPHKRIRFLRRKTQKVFLIRTLAPSCVDVWYVVQQQQLKIWKKYTLPASRLTVYLYLLLFLFDVSLWHFELLQALRLLF